MPWRLFKVSGKAKTDDAFAKDARNAGAAKSHDANPVKRSRNPFQEYNCELAIPQ
jgi:hypothetical protein